MPHPNKPTIFRRVLNSLSSWYFRKKVEKDGTQKLVQGLNHALKEQRTERQEAHRMEKPWLYPGGSGLRWNGIPRDTDVIDLRRMALAPVVQLCVGAKQEEVKKTPWAIVKTDVREKRLQLAKNPYKRDKRMIKAMVSNAENDPLTTELAELLSNPNQSGQGFPDLLNSIVGDCCEVGNACLNLVFEKDACKPIEHKEDGQGGRLKTKDHHKKLGDRDVEYNAIEIPKDADKNPTVKPVAIEPVDPLCLNKDLNRFGVLKGFYYVPFDYNIASVLKVKYMQKEEMVWFDYDKRSYRNYGWGDVEKCQSVIDTLLLAMEQEMNIFATGCITPGMLYGDSPDITEQEVETVKSVYQEMLKGHPENILISGKKFGWLPFTYNYQELQYLERKLWDCKQIISVFKLTPSFVGLETDKSNRATAFVSKQTAYEKGIGPLLKFIEQVINTQLVWRFWFPDKSYSFVFDPTVDIDEMERISTVAVNQYRGGLVTKNEGRKKIGHDDVPDGDEFYTEPAPQGMPGSSPTNPADERQYDETDYHEGEPILDDTDVEDVDEDELDEGAVKPKSFRHKAKATGEIEPVDGGFLWIVYDSDGNVFDEGTAKTKPIAEALIAHHIEDIAKEKKLDPTASCHPTYYRQLYKDIKDLYGEVFDGVLEQMEAHKAEFASDVQKKVLNMSGVMALVDAVIRDKGLIRKLVSSVIGVSGKEIIRTMKEESVRLDLDYKEDREDDAIARLTERRMSYYQDIPDTLTDTVIQTLVDTIEQGRSYEDAIKTLKVLREDFTTHRAETIVRTELGRSRREAKQLFAEQYADLLNKRWRSARDKRTRDSHRAMNGVTIPVKDKFQVPYHLDNPKYTDEEETYPGETKKGINCRCLLITERKKEA